MSHFEHKIVSIDEIIPYINNARTHGADQIAQLAGAISEFGFTNPVLIDEESNLIAGHGRVLAARQLRIEEIPAVVITGLDENRRKALVLADNKLALNADWNEEMLVLELQALGDDAGMTGFSQEELIEILGGETSDGLTDDDAVPEIQEEAISNRGDIWLCGNHRVMCGDSTSVDDVEKLMGGQKADMVFTDPPYGINEKGDRTARNTGLAKNHNFRDFKDDTTQYAIDAYNLCEGLKIMRQVWGGANYYCHSLPQSNNWFIWDKRVEEKMQDTQSDCEMAWVKSEFSSVRIFRHLWKGFNKGSERGEPRIHPTQKPVALAEWAFDYFKNVSSVLDLFGGSGSTLIACEKTNRNCRMMELDEKYCDVIIRRWQDFTGREATMESTGEKFNASTIE